MGKGHYFFTSESVTEGHPDKVADAISDSILDAMIEKDKNSRVACETLVTTGLAMVAGEITTHCYVDIPELVRETIRDIGYHSSQMGFDWQTCSVITSIDQQSSGYRTGRQCRRRAIQGTGSRRSGLDVRLCLQRNPGTHADAHHVCPSIDPPPGNSP